MIADLPCSGLGVIRKKPDIRFRDRESLVWTDVDDAGLRGFIESEYRIVSAAKIWLPIIPGIIIIAFLLSIFPFPSWSAPAPDMKEGSRSSY